MVIIVFSKLTLREVNRRTNMHVEIVPEYRTFFVCYIFFCSFIICVYVNTTNNWFEIGGSLSVADPGFPVGRGHRAVGGAPTSDMGAFRQKHMQKRKNWILLGGGRAPAAPTWIRQCLWTILSD